MSNEVDLCQGVERFLAQNHPAALGFWTDAHDIPETSLQSLCDALYALHLLDKCTKVNPKAARAFVDRLNTVALAGGLTSPPTGAKAINVHGTAYALGVLRLLRLSGLLEGEIALSGKHWDMTQLFDKTWRPRWPARYSHHNWRVSHWTGGAVSILANLHELFPKKAASQNLPPLTKVLDRANSLIDPRTGLLKCYRSDVLQKIFRNLYRLRHDPDAGDIGGVVHLHWINWAAGNLPYKAAGPMLQTATRLLEKRPFQETFPFCLDFDVLQIVRTGLGDHTAPGMDLIARSKAYSDDIEGFLVNSASTSFSLHALPGALATIHEAALLQSLPFVSGTNIKARDIIKESGWI